MVNSLELNTKENKKEIFVCPELKAPVSCVIRIN